MNPLDTINELKGRMGRSIIGQEHIVERLLIGTHSLVPFTSPRPGARAAGPKDNKA